LRIARPAVLAFNAVVNAVRQAEIGAAPGAAGQPAAELLDHVFTGLGLPRPLRTSARVGEPIDSNSSPR
jgi:hypothetical protein